MPASPHLAFLGDVFAIPAPFPLADVFSVDDVLVLIGGDVTVRVSTGPPVRSN